LRQKNLGQAKQSRSRPGKAGLLESCVRISQDSWDSWDSAQRPQLSKDPTCAWLPTLPEANRRASASPARSAYQPGVALVSAILPRHRKTASLASLPCRPKSIGAKRTTASKKRHSQKRTQRRFPVQGEVRHVRLLSEGFGRHLQPVLGVSHDRSSSPLLLSAAVLRSSDDPRRRNVTLVPYLKPLVGGANTACSARLV